ncbi:MULTISPECIES: low molecular weight phosphatase family protein [unclassified Ectothiorhodospira]|uniref:arsenate-mycothiol transferase ArsC n=1 Tax=unclassified Ectothiorhodospira TaxID=2684909 RepID=UPI001EE8C2DB|nr:MULTISPECIES: arsenate reductase ArsC [unclassified Ectothiorhodospira]MCG5515309.1 arsenate reductase ArsC [Ectothiorhodospira sp. 9100]MCG5519410.1 arsenate reductase ArsC [Ectothiorhodospira sp. 9905]
MPEKPDLRRKPHILFLGHTNTARTLVAEAYARQRMPDLVEVRSAGLQAGKAQPRVMTVLREEDLESHALEAKALDRDLVAWADMIITLCTDPAKLPLPAAESFVCKNWPMDPPSRFATDGDDLEPFRRMRDDVKRRVRLLANSMRLMQR